MLLDMESSRLAPRANNEIPTFIDKPRDLEAGIGSCGEDVELG